MADIVEHHQDDPRPNEKGSQEFTPAVAFAMGEIKGSVENLRNDLRDWKEDSRAAISAATSPIALTVADHEARLRVIEKWKWMIAGAAAAGGLAGGKLMDFILKATQ